MPKLDRRQALGRMAAGAVGVIAGPAALANAAKTAAPAPDLEALADRFRAAPRVDTFTVAADAIRRGADVTAVLGAVFLCGVREIRPRPHGILHSVMMVGSCFQLADASPAAEAWPLVLWNLDDLKASMEEDKIEAGDWSLRPPRPARAATAEAARQELVAALEDWDAERADAALAGFLPHCDRAALFEVLWPYMARCYAFIGHKAIYAMQVERVLARIGWCYAEPALRSLVTASLVGRNTSAFDHARELAGRFPDGWERGREDTAESVMLLRTLRTDTAPAAQEAVAEAIRGGLGPRTVWDALRLLGSEVFLKRSGRRADSGRQALLPVHALTVVNALGHAARTTSTDATRRLLVLQAARWLAAMRDDLAGLAAHSMAGPGIETLGDDATPAPSFGGAVHEAMPARVRRYLDDVPADRERYRSLLRRSLMFTAQEHHQHKYTAAVEEESRFVHPRWASRILAPAVDYIAHPYDRETEVYRRAKKALAAV